MVLVFVRVSLCDLSVKTMKAGGGGEADSLLSFSCACVPKAAGLYPSNHLHQ